MPKQYDKIRLQTGEIGRILEDFQDGAYIAEISRKTGGIDTVEIRLGEISSVFHEEERPLQPA